MTHYMHLNPSPFGKIRAGQKTIELRLWDEKRRLIAPGDVIEFTSTADRRQTLAVRVVALHPFPDFAALYAALPLEKCGYTAEEARLANPSDMESYYSIEAQRANGVVGIEFELLRGGQNTLTALSKFISLILRHKPEEIGITLDEHGWADVEELIAGISRKQPIDRATLEEIVATDDKQRYSFSEDGKLIRANQGHSIPVDVELAQAEPPEYLWHGTAARFVPSIEAQGLLPCSRLYVHLSADERTARIVGARHGAPALYRVRAGAMRRAGIPFFLSQNGVWLVKHVPVEYLERVV